MTKKRFFLIFLLVVCCPSGCGKESQYSDNEVLIEPEYETRSIVHENEKAQLYNGWERIDSFFKEDGVIYIYYPYIENKIKGVSYVEDSYDLDYDLNVFKNINCPVGCKSIKHKAEGSCVSQSNSQPELEGASIIKSNNPLTVVKEGEIMVGEGNATNNTMVSKWKIQTQDVQAISFAIYEDFFETIPKLTVNLYGIPVTLWEEEFGSGMEFSGKQYDEFQSRCENNNFAQLDLLAEKKIEKTGVYYIDYNDMHEKGNYAQILIVLNFDKEMPYTYRMCGDGIYEISDKEAYNEWKNNNINCYIQ